MICRKSFVVGAGVGRVGRERVVVKTFELGDAIAACMMGVGASTGGTWPELAVGSCREATQANRP